MTTTMTIRVAAEGRDNSHTCEAAIRFVPHFDREHHHWELAAAGKLNRGRCETCGRTIDADRPFLYTDLKNRKVAIIVAPEKPSDPDALPAALPGSFIGSGAPPLRFGRVIGLDRFRELLWMHELGISPQALRHAADCAACDAGAPERAATLRLIEADEEKAIFVPAAADGHAEAPTYSTPIEEVEKLATATSTDPQPARQEKVIAWLAALDTRGDDELERCRTALLAIIEQNAQAGDIAGEMVKLLLKSPLEPEVAAGLFQQATGIALSPPLIQQLRDPKTGKSATLALWQAFADLPPRLRRRSVLSLEEIGIGTVLAGPTAVYVPDESPADFDRILISAEILRSSDLAHALRHEVAHAVHDRCREQVDAWLHREFGWTWHVLPESWIRKPEALIAPIDGWIDELGGWAKAAPLAVSDEERAAHRRMIWTACQPGVPPHDVVMCSFLTGPAEQRSWFGDSLARRVHLATGSDWWCNSARWVELPRSDTNLPRKLAMMNYQYRELATVNVVCRGLVDAQLIPNRYAMMSHREFFAEFYATWFGENSALRRLYPEFETFIAELTTNAS